MVNRRQFIKATTLSSIGGPTVMAEMLTVNKNKNEANSAATEPAMGEHDAAPARKRPNVLMLITDQQRADCLGIAGHPMIKTPNMDRLAKRGVRFSNAFVQSQPCGPSRICIDTGRYMHAHRSTWNEAPVPDDERTTGNYFKQAGYRCGWIGKTGYVPDFFMHPPEKTPEKPYEWYRTPPDFENVAFDMGQPGAPYTTFLSTKGYAKDAFLSGFGTAVRSPEGEYFAAADFRAIDYPQVVKAEDTETAFFSNRAIDFIREAGKGEKPWLLSVNYFSPHHPWVAPEPYHSMYDPAKTPPPNRTLDELQNMHPVARCYRQERGGPALDDETYMRKARAVYYGMITEIDDNIGRIMEALEKSGQIDNTIIVFMSDHGEFVGDHWLCFKEFWYRESCNIPLIICDPAKEADATRGHVQDAMIEEIDILPTIMELSGQKIPYQIQGRSLKPMLTGCEAPADWVQEVHMDWDFRFMWTGHELGLPNNKCRMYQLRDRVFNFIHFNGKGLPDILYDLEKDPNEQKNVSGEANYKEVLERYRLKMLDWRMDNEDNSRIGWVQERRPRFGANVFRIRSPWPPFN